MVCHEFGHRGLSSFLQGCGCADEGRRRAALRHALQQPFEHCGSIAGNGDGGRIVHRERRRVAIDTDQRVGQRGLPGQRRVFVEMRAERETDIRLAHDGRDASHAGDADRERVIFRDDAARLVGCDDRSAERFRERNQRAARARTDNTVPRIDQRRFRFLQECECRFQLCRIGLRRDHRWYFPAHLT